MYECYDNGYGHYFYDHRLLIAFDACVNTDNVLLAINGQQLSLD